MPSPANFEVNYSGGTVDVPHLGITLRRIFACAAESHDISRDGREVRLTIQGVPIGVIQLKDANLKGTAANGRTPSIRKSFARR